MSFKITTDALPSAERPPLFYAATASTFELRTGKTSGEPYINVTLLDDQGNKRFDGIYLKARWFDPAFDPHQIVDPKERTAFYSNVGARNKTGRLQRYLGRETETEFTSPTDVLQALVDNSTGKRFYVVQVQRKDDEGNPTDQYNLRLYNERPSKLPLGTLVLLQEEEVVETP